MLKSYSYRLSAAGSSFRERLAWNEPRRLPGVRSFLASPKLSRSIVWAAKRTEGLTALLLSGTDSSRTKFAAFTPFVGGIYETQ